MTNSMLKLLTFTCFTLSVVGMVLTQNYTQALYILSFYGVAYMYVDLVDDLEKCQEMLRDALKLVGNKEK
jgi:hypothetical protein